LAWTALAVNVGVILLGALVRATGSGAGCGRSWPTCSGEIFPTFDDTARAIEFLHRATSGVALLIVLLLYVAVRRAWPAGSMPRCVAFVAVLTIIGEALIGAGIVLFEWVADDASVARAIAVPLHLVNTLLLLAALTAVLYLVRGAEIERPTGELRRLLRMGLGGLVLVAATGAVAALADTLFPADSLEAGIVEDFSATANLLTRMRVVHPIVAVFVGLLVVWIVSRPTAVAHLRDRSPSRLVTWAVVAQIAAGLLNVVLLVPVWMQIVHLFLADVLWIAFVWFSLDALDVRQRSAMKSS